MIKIEIKKLDKRANLPKFSHQGDVCADLSTISEIIIKANQTKILGCGISMAIPYGYEAVIRPRSGLAAKHSITVLNAPGTIDSGYRGEIKVILKNHSNKSFKINAGDRVAQIGIRKVPMVSFVEVDELCKSKRGNRGIGSTGI